MYSYLKQETYYQDRYDLFTIEECLGIIESYRKRLIPQELQDYQLFFIKGERYRNKSSTIREWMQKDRKCDEKLETAREPTNISCPNCARGMVVTLKELVHLEVDTQKVLFFFECRLCGKRKGVYDDGEPFVSRARLCPKCKAEVRVSSRASGATYTITTTCNSCDFKDEDVSDSSKDAQEKEEREKIERELLAKHRSEFCLSEAEGYEYVETISRLKTLGEMLKDSEQQRTDSNYQKMLKLRKLSITELETLVSEAIGKERYIKLVLCKPEIGKDIIVSFMAQDADVTRKEDSSLRKLRRVIKGALEGTNWHLMSEGISYKLGCLSGRLRGYDLEEDLLSLVRANG